MTHLTSKIPFLTCFIPRLTCQKPRVCGKTVLFSRKTAYFRGEIRRDARVCVFRINKTPKNRKVTIMAIPTRDAEFASYADDFTEQVRTNQKKWGVRDEMFVPLRRANNAAQAALRKSNAPSTAGNAATIGKQTAIATLREVINFFHDYLRGSFDLVTDEDLVRLGISPRKQKAHEPVVLTTVNPNITVTRTGFYKFSVVTKEEELGGQRTKRIRDKRLHPFIVVRYCFIPIDMKVPVDREELPWITNQAVGHARTTIDATSKAGMKLVAQSAFHNTAGTGPWSEPFEIIVS